MESAVLISLGYIYAVQERDVIQPSGSLTEVVGVKEDARKQWQLISFHFDRGPPIDALN